MEESLNHPVFTCLDMLNLFNKLQSFQSELNKEESSTIKNFFHYFDELHGKFISFSKNRGLHIDNQTFSNFQNQLKRAVEIEKQHLLLINSLQQELKELKSTNKMHKIKNKELQEDIIFQNQFAKSEQQKLETRITYLQEQNTIIEKQFEDSVNRISTIENHWKTKYEQAIQQMKNVIRTPRKLLSSVATQTHSSEENKNAEASKKEKIQDETPPTNQQRIIWESILTSFQDFNVEGVDRVEEAVILNELNILRMEIDGGYEYGGEAWEHIMSCGILATIVALKQRLRQTTNRNRTILKIPTLSSRKCVDVLGIPRLPMSTKKKHDKGLKKSIQFNGISGNNNGPVTPRQEPPISSNARHHSLKQREKNIRLFTYDNNKITNIKGLSLRK